MSGRLTISTNGTPARLKSISEWSLGPIRIVLSSSGGSEPDGFALYDALNLSRSKVTIDCFGEVQSIAALVLQAADERRMSPECRLMMHNGTLEFGGAVHQGTMVAVARESDIRTKRYQQILAENSKASFEEVAAFCNEEKYFSAEEAVALGFADSIITQESLGLKSAKKAAKKAQKKSKQTIELDMSQIERVLNKRKK
jgi:ATP-dependent protease ClpP protease subunit